MSHVSKNILLILCWHGWNKFKKVWSWSLAHEIASLIKKTLIMFFQSVILLSNMHTFFHNIRKLLTLLHLTYKSWWLVKLSKFQIFFLDLSKTLKLLCRCHHSLAPINPHKAPSSFNSCYTQLFQNAKNSLHPPINWTSSSAFFSHDRHNYFLL
jgi:hypothetical protein